MVASRQDNISGFNSSLDMDDVHTPARTFEELSILRTGQDNPGSGLSRKWSQKRTPRTIYQGLSIPGFLSCSASYVRAAQAFQKLALDQRHVTQMELKLSDIRSRYC
ncbi:hypothetical protein K449DRAFT_430839 [Hypoxylon sp. EC38]|nr:hypothetical protein K449DRAFT_430839 [Hypoxylon sp. EC38]